MRLAKLGCVLCLCLLLALPAGAVTEGDDSFYDVLGIPAGDRPTSSELQGEEEANGAQASAEEDFSAEEVPSQGNTLVDPETDTGSPVSTQGVWNYYLPLELFTGDTQYLILVNKDHPLGSGDKPDDLVKTTVARRRNVDLQLRREANDALQAMCDAAKEEGLTLYIDSAYRSYQTQATMYENRLEKNGGKDDGYVQSPGASEHQTGICADVLDKGTIDGGTYTRTFEATAHAQWMAEHCWEYGFIIRYPKNKEEITGIHFEPWHLRYVGSVDIAAYITHNGLTLEEFTEEWQGALRAYDPALLPES